MNKNMLFVLGLSVSCDSLWATQPLYQLRTPIVCVQRGQVIISASGLTGPPAVSIINTNPCAADSSSGAPLTGAMPMTINAADVTLTDSGFVAVTLPRELPAGSYEITLQIPGSDSTTTPGCFRYSAQQSKATTLAQRLDLTGPNGTQDTTDFTVWHPRAGQQLDVAILTSSGTSLSYYQNIQAGLAPGGVVPPSATTTATAFSANLLATELDASGSPGQKTLVVGTSEQKKSVGLYSVTGDPKTPSIAGQVAVDKGMLPVEKQFVAAGHFVADSGADQTQLISIVGMGTGTTVNAVLYKNPHTNPTAAGTLLTWAALRTGLFNLKPAAVVPTNLNDDLLTDGIVIIDTGVPNLKFAAFAVLGGGDGSLAPYELTVLKLASPVVAVGDLDGNGHPDVVFGQPGGGFAINYNLVTTGPQSMMVGQPGSVATVMPPATVVISDYNGDGKNDIVYTAVDGVHVLLNQGAPSAGAMPTFVHTLAFAQTLGATPWMPTSHIEVVDFAGDSRPDYVVADQSGHLFFLENTCTPAP